MRIFLIANIFFDISFAHTKILIVLYINKYLAKKKPLYFKKKKSLVLQNKNLHIIRNLVRQNWNCKY